MMISDNDDDDNDNGQTVTLSVCTSAEFANKKGGGFSYLIFHRKTGETMMVTDDRKSRISHQFHGKIFGLLRQYTMVRG